MIRSLVIDRQSRSLAEQIAGRTKNDVPVVIEMTAHRPGSLPGRNHVDAINFFEGVMDRLDRTVSGGWLRSLGWSELDHGSKHYRSGRRLYLYTQARIGLSEMRRLDVAAADLAKSMNVRYGLGMAAGMAMTSAQIRRHDVGGERDALLALVTGEPDIHRALGRYSVRARWLVAGRPVGNFGQGERIPYRGRLYLTLVRRGFTSRRISPRLRPDAGFRAHVLELRNPISAIAPRVTGKPESD